MNMAKNFKRLKYNIIIIYLYLYIKYLKIKDNIFILK